MTHLTASTTSWGDCQAQWAVHILGSLCVYTVGQSYGLFSWEWQGLPWPRIQFCFALVRVLSGLWDQSWAVSFPTQPELSTLSIPPVPHGDWRVWVQLLLLSILIYLRYILAWLLTWWMALLGLFQGDNQQRTARIANSGYKCWRWAELMDYYILHMSGERWEQQQAYSEQGLYQSPKIWNNSWPGFQGFSGIFTRTACMEKESVNLC